MSDMEKIMILCGVRSEEELMEHIQKYFDNKRKAEGERHHAE